MNPTDAFSQLGLPISATAEEIDARFRDLAREHHPDAGGDGARMASITAARDAALAYASASRALVPLNAVRDLVLASAGALSQRQEAREEVARVEQRAIKRANNRMRQLKEISGFAGGASAVGMFLLKDLPEDAKTILASSGFSSGTIMLFGICIVVYAAMFWSMANRSIRRMEAGLEDFTRSISTRTGYSALLRNVLNDGWRGPWTQEDLREAATRKPGKGRPSSLVRVLIPPHIDADEWPSIARVIGDTEFVHLILAKGRELGVLHVSESETPGGLVEHYTFAVPPANLT